MYQAKDLVIHTYLNRVQALEKELNDHKIVVRYKQIPGDENEEVNLLSKLSMKELEQLPDEVYVQ